VHDRRKHRLLGQYIRDTRVSAGMTQSRVADALKKPQSYVAKIEAGERRVDVLEFIQLFQAMGIDIHTSIEYIRSHFISE
jgi:transcriptional regulator with XRE-family HTH domain